MKFKTIEVFFEAEFYVIKLRKSANISQLQEYIGDAFYKGAEKIRFYKDYRRKNDYIEIIKESYDKQFCENSYKKLKKESNILTLKKRIEILNSGIEFNKKLIKTLKIELKKTQTS
ncbi:MAG: hypothetical protein WCT77_05870 [Bacteroidota bacterium]